MRRILYIFTSVLAIASCRSGEKMFADRALDWCDAKVALALDRLSSEDGVLDPSLSPRNIAPGDSTWSTRPVCKELWTAGFWPGILWYSYGHNGNPRTAEAAALYTER
ncbi:MAG: hypothetical protein HUJ94_08920, partial [Bacteroidales bacterium]|nr:hypothetical protein [Bacteroidales bacterium]